MNLVDVAKKFKLHISMCGVSAYALIFGVLLKVYTNDTTYYDNCSDLNFISWATSTANSLLSIVGLCVITCIIYPTVPVQKEAFIVFSGLAIFLLFTCLVGITSSSNSDCGSLHTLTLAYYITQYIALAVGLAFSVKYIKSAVTHPKDK